jgi:hypothetical protein
VCAFASARTDIFSNCSFPSLLTAARSIEKFHYLSSFGPVEFLSRKGPPAGVSS